MLHASCFILILHASCFMLAASCFMLHASCFILHASCLLPNANATLGRCSHKSKGLHIPTLGWGACDTKTPKHSGASEHKKRGLEPEATKLGAPAPGHVCVPVVERVSHRPSAPPNPLRHGFAGTIRQRTGGFL